MTTIAITRVRRVLLLALGNVAVFVALFALLESGLRISRDGFRETCSRIVHGEPAPYSSIGTGKWVISDPELGYRLNPDQEEINSLSIRHPEVTIPKPQGLFRLVVLGDSIPFAKGAFGFVADIAKRIEAPGTLEVINAAVPGYTSFQELTFFKRYVQQVDPDLVVWTYCLNDNHKFLHRFDEAANMLFTDEAARSLEIRSWWDWIVSRSYVLTSIRMGLLARQEPAPARAGTFVWEARPDFNIAWKDYSWHFYESHLAEMVDLVKRRGARLAIVAFPYEPQLVYRMKRDRRDEILAPQHHLERLCRKYSVPYLDLYPSFERAYDQGRTLYRDGIHPNQEGHALTTEVLLDFLNAQQLLPRRAGGAAQAMRHSFDNGTSAAANALGANGAGLGFDQLDVVAGIHPLACPNPTRHVLDGADADTSETTLDAADHPPRARPRDDADGRRPVRGQAGPVREPARVRQQRGRPR